jgi:hypothetical protein
MSAALRVIAVPGSGAEDVLVVTSGPDAGAVVTGTDDGSIWRIHGDGSRIDRIASPRDPLVERLQHGPRWLRRRVTRIPERVQPRPRRTVRVQAYDPAGALVRDVSIDTDDFHMVTGVREHEGRVWLGSLEEPAVAVVDLAG